MIRKNPTVTGKSFMEQVDELQHTLESMGYEITRWDSTNHPDAPKGTVTLSGYDDIGNYVELTEMTVFTIGDARTYVTRLYKAWQGIYAKGVRQGAQSFQQMYDSLSKEEKEAFNRFLQGKVNEKSATEEEVTTDTDTLQA